MDALAGGNRAANDEDGVVAADGAEYVAPALAVEGSGDRLGAAGYRPQHQHLAHTVNAQEKLWKKGVERSSALLNVAVGDGVARAFWSRHSGQTELAQIAREGRLGDIPASLQKQLTQILLAADGARANYLEDGVVSFALVGHAKILARQKAIREANPESLTT